MRGVFLSVRSMSHNASKFKGKWNMYRKACCGVTHTEKYNLVWLFLVSRGFQQMNNIGNNDNIDNIAICVFAHICSFLLNSNHIVLVNAKFYITRYRRIIFQARKFWTLIKFQIAQLKHKWQYRHSCIAGSFWKPRIPLISLNCMNLSMRTLRTLLVIRSSLWFILLWEQLWKNISYFIYICFLSRCHKSDSLEPITQNLHIKSV